MLSERLKFKPKLKRLRRRSFRLRKKNRPISEKCRWSSMRLKNKLDKSKRKSKMRKMKN
jgi:hypothetical protein